MRHAAKKIETGSYLYRGFFIERVTDFDHQQGKNITLWNIFEDGCIGDTADTLRGAKFLIDSILWNRETNAGN